MHDEELRAAAVIAVGARHRKNASFVAYGVFNAVCGKFALDVVVAAARAVALWVTALDHKALDDPVEGQTVVEALVYKVEEVLNGDRRVGGVEDKADGAVVLNVDSHSFRGAGVRLFVAL